MQRTKIPKVTIQPRKSNTKHLNIFRSTPLYLQRRRHRNFLKNNSLVRVHVINFVNEN